MANPTHIEIRPFALHVDAAANSTIVSYMVVAVQSEAPFLAYPVSKGKAPLELPAPLHEALMRLMQQVGDHIHVVLGLAEAPLPSLESAAHDGTPIERHEEPL